MPSTNGQHFGATAPVPYRAPQSGQLYTPSFPPPVYYRDTFGLQPADDQPMPLFDDCVYNTTNGGDADVSGPRRSRASLSERRGHRISAIDFTGSVDGSEQPADPEDAVQAENGEDDEDNDAAATPSDDDSFTTKSTGKHKKFFYFNMSEYIKANEISRTLLSLSKNKNC